MTPEFVTFTGIDSKTDMARCEELSRKYPIEWGVLISATNKGNRYPDAMARAWFLRHRLNFAAHLCGGPAKEFMDGKIDTAFYYLPWYNRIQVNRIEYDFDRLRTGCTAAGIPTKRVIAQHREGDFPSDPSFNYLLDRSGGRGVVETNFPSARKTKAFCGYAGGISGDNVVEVIKNIDAEKYWLDMESSLRDSEDWMDLDKCEDVCQKIWG